ncbi:LacI family DNA-binding transcriptional regulator [Dactylosporangium sp. NPDC051541]|uniref:LacI family DNA-binding transcriptional regulator n=1 Tax=Dactylosporangium sp. NPDC051541 TaxID=3363977 RepID=UPI0037AAEB0F
MKRPTIFDIARRADVSIAAVSFALNGRGGVSAETRRRVLSIAAELGWRPSHQARGLATRRSSTAGLVVLATPNQLAGASAFGAFVEGVQARLGADGTETMLRVLPAPQDAADLVAKWRSEQRIDGVIVGELAGRCGPELAAAVHRQPDLPAVVVGVAAGAEHDSQWSTCRHLVWDEAQCVRLAVYHLAELGHRHIVRCAGPRERRYTTLRNTAFRTAVQELGLPHPVIASTGPTAEHVRAAVERLLTAPVPPTAILFDDPLQAAAGLDAIRELGIAVPAELSVMCIGEDSHTHLLQPPLTAVTRGDYELGRRAAEALLGLIDAGDAERPAAPPPRVHIRSSATPPRGHQPPSPARTAADSGPVAGPPSRGVRMRDIAAAAGVSRVAVSYALNGQPGVSARTRGRIQQLAAAAGFVANATSIQLHGRSTHCIGLIVPRSAAAGTTFRRQELLLGGVEEVLAPDGWTLALYSAADVAEAAAISTEWHVRGRVDGVLVVADGNDVATLAAVEAPMVVVGPRSDDHRLLSVSVDDHAASRQMIGHLVELGHRNAAWVPGLQRPGAGVARTALAARLGLHVTTPGRRLRPLGPAECARLVRSALIGRPRPTVLLCGDDLAAIRAAAIAREVGLNVPDDLSIVAWSDGSMLAAGALSITAIDRDEREQGAAAARTLLAVLDHHSAANELLEATLAIRRSSVPPRPTP